MKLFHFQKLSYSVKEELFSMGRCDWSIKSAMYVSYREYASLFTTLV